MLLQAQWTGLCVKALVPSMTLPRCPLCETEIRILLQNLEGKKNVIDIVCADHAVKCMVINTMLLCAHMGEMKVKEQLVRSTTCYLKCPVCDPQTHNLLQHIEG